MDGEIAGEEGVVAPCDFPCCTAFGGVVVVGVAVVLAVAFPPGGLLHACGHWGAPEEGADEVVFADVVGEEIDAGAAGGRGGGGGGGQGVEVGAAEHVAFADDAGGDGGGVDAGVEFGVGGCLEHLFKATARNGENAVGEIEGRAGSGNGICCD